jgi:hypothetical protein
LIHGQKNPLGMPLASLSCKKARSRQEEPPQDEKALIVPVASAQPWVKDPEIGVCSMLKKLFGAASFVALTVWCTGTVQAAPITFTDLIAPAVPVYMNGYTSPKTHTVTHDITDGVPLPAFIPGFHTVSEGTLKMTLNDDVLDDTGEFIKITVGGTDYGPWQVDIMDVFIIPLNSTALADLNLDGKVSATITMTNVGDVNFIRSELVAETSPTPEPSTLILVGSGLAGVIGFGLRRRKNEEANSPETVTI